MPTWALFCAALSLHAALSIMLSSRAVMRSGVLYHADFRARTRRARALSAPRMRFRPRRGARRTHGALTARQASLSEGAALRARRASVFCPAKSHHGGAFIAGADHRNDDPRPSADVRAGARGLGAEVAGPPKARP